jgi:hypothetical protein
MEINYLDYSLITGYIHRWIVAGPQINFFNIPEDQKILVSSDKEKLFLLFRMPFAGLGELPVERDLIRVNDQEYRWNYYRCGDDHQVHATTQQTNWHILRTWAYTQLEIPQSCEVTILLFTQNPIQVWLNSQIVFDTTAFNEKIQKYSFKATLNQKNELLVIFESLSESTGSSNFALQVMDIPEGINPEEFKVLVPTHARFTRRYQHYETLFENAYLENIAKYYGDHFNLHWMEEVKDDLHYEHRVLDSEERIYAGGRAIVDAHKPRDVGHFQRLFERQFYVGLTAPEREYWEHDLRYTKKLPIFILDTEYTERPYGSPASRRLEALKYAANRETNLFGMIARLELGQWNELKNDVVLGAVQQIENRDQESALFLVGLILLVYRFQENEEFPESLKEAIKRCILNYRYETGKQDLEGIEKQKESLNILALTAETLAGQLYREEIFTISEKKGEWHKKHGQKFASAWLQAKGQNGFAAWSSNNLWQDTILALAQLTSLAKSKELAELAAIVLDKMLFLMAVNSYKGSFGVSHGITNANMLKSSQLEATSGIMRMLWGVGVFNPYISGMVGLACSEYEYPAFYFNIANEPPVEFLSKERHNSSVGSEVNLVLYKTPDYLLSSAQDYHPGSTGKAEHIWQATLGNEAIVFVNHPACSNEENAYQPGFWLGNASLPRVAQWKDALIAIYNLPVIDWMRFTHAYFPLPAFDDFFFSERWAFLKKGNGYLALAASKGFEFIRQGPNAYRELRSNGLKNIWVCQMGRAELDGDFSDFRKKVLALKFKAKDLSIFFNTLRGEELSFGWEESLRVNGNDQPITGFKHIENPYCTAEFPAGEMQITYQDNLFKLNFQ